MSEGISLQTTTYQAPDRRWLLAEPKVKFGQTVDTTKFVANTHFPNGYIPSGVALGIVTATKLLGPYDDTKSDGTQTFYGYAYDDIRVTLQNGTNATQVPVGVVTFDAAVSVARLPFQSGAGSIDANGKADNPNIRHEA